jgi:hypothetical protein
MSEVEETSAEHAQPHPLWWAALGYAALVGFGWLVIALRRLLYWRTAVVTAEAVAAGGNLERVNEINNFAGSLLVDIGYAFAATALCACVLIALARRSWNAWDYATVAAGFATVLSGIFICARDRVMFFLPFTIAPLLVLLYMPGVKWTCGVGATSETPSVEDAPVAPLTSQDLERELARERTLVSQLRQNLDVFEVERRMDTDTFVDRYAKGLEEETPDNAEWFSIARAVRRSQERITELSAQWEARS